jgi:hypothetical protein
MDPESAVTLLPHKQDADPGADGYLPPGGLDILLDLGTT